MEGIISKERLAHIRALAKNPMLEDRAIRRVDIIVLKYKEEPSILTECLGRIATETQWPFKMTVLDNRMNTANMSKIWNKLIRESTCDYLLIMDSDAFVPRGLTPCWLTRLMESVDESGIVVPVCANAGGENKETDQAPYPSKRKQIHIWGGPVSLYKKSIFDEVGYFDERFYLYGQDSEFAHRFLKKGHGATYRTDVLIDHVGNHSADRAGQDGELDIEAERAYARTLFQLTTRGRL